MSLKKSTRAKSSSTSKKSSSARTPKKSGARRRPFGAGAILVAAMCVLGMMVIAAHGLTPAPRKAAMDPEPETVTASAPAQKATPAAASPVDAAIAVPSETDAPSATSTAGKIAPVTIFGCLERSNENLRLTDTDGVDAPKARSWKTGFFKKGSTSIGVLDPGNRVRLASHVGERVSVTGVLADRQMQVRSMRRISASCN